MSEYCKFVQFPRKNILCFAHAQSGKLTGRLYTSECVWGVSNGGCESFLSCKWGACLRAGVEFEV